MKKRNVYKAAVLITLLLACLMGCGRAKKEVREGQEIQINASSAFFPMTKNIIKSIYEESKESMPVVTQVATNDGFFNISAGKTDLLISSIPDDRQKKCMEESEQEIVSVPITREPLVILVNKDNPVDSITMEELTSMYLGEDENWRDYGGENLAVTTYQLTEGNGSQTAFSQYIEGTRLGESHREIATMNAIVDAVGADPGGVCYAFGSFLFRMYSNDATKVIRIDGKSFADPEYPLTCTVSAYYRKESGVPVLEKIIAYLESDEGKNLVHISSLYGSK